MRGTKFIEPLNCRLTVRFTPTEYGRLRHISSACRLSIAEVVRRRTLNMKIPKTDTRILTELNALRGVVAKHGGLFKHLYNLNPIYSNATAAALNEQVKLYGKISKDYDALRNRMYTEIENDMKAGEDNDDL